MISGSTANPGDRPGPACRAVIAARLQGAQFDRAMTHAIQRAYYQNAKNPSDDAVLIELAVALGLDSAAFTAQLNSGSARQQLEQEIMFSRQLGVRGFPSLLLLAGNSSRVIQINFTDFKVMLEDIISQ